MIATTILAKAEGQRLERAVHGLVHNAFSITPTVQTASEIRGFVKNGDGEEYGLVLSEEQSFCSCKDSVFRHTVCKHAVALALHTIRNPPNDAVLEQAHC